MLAAVEAGRRVIAPAQDAQPPGRHDARAAALDDAVAGPRAQVDEHLAAEAVRATGADGARAAQDRHVVAALGADDVGAGHAPVHRHRGAGRRGTRTRATAAAGAARRTGRRGARIAPGPYSRGPLRCAVAYPAGMCRNIRTLYNFEPPATDDEVQAAALQYVRKISGFTKPSKANEEAFARAVEDVAAVSRRLLGELSTTAPPKDRDVVAAKARARAELRYAS